MTFSPPHEASGHNRPKKGLFSVVLIAFSVLVLLGLVLLAVAIAYEMRTSRLQAWFFSRVAQRLSYRVTSGESPAIRFPAYGPYNIRLGYARIPEWTERMGEQGFVVADQARWSADLQRYTDWGLFPPYPEKTQAGLRILDGVGQEIVRSIYPQRVYPDFASIPPVVTRMLLFIENRQLLDPLTPYRNPAVEWQRMGKAFWDAAMQMVDKQHHVAGGSTLATQIEKFRHSEDGLTAGAREKLRQIVSATVRAYQTGEMTGDACKRIVLDYVNSIPLAAAFGFGEVIGLGDGLWAWYGVDFEKVNQALADADRPDLSEERLNDIGAGVRAVLSLFISQRRPSMYLISRRDRLRTLTDDHIRLLMKENVLPARIGQAALKSGLDFRKGPLPASANGITQRKSANLIRTRMLGHLNLDRVYDLDRFDLTVKTTIDIDLQRKITEKLYAIRDPLVAQKAGLREKRLLESSNPAGVVYSLSLYEHTALGNLLRVQTNNFEGPFNIDEQMKLDLGSSAKLRTLVHYLEIIAELHKRYANLADSELRRIAGDPAPDSLTRWTADYLATNSGADLTATLDAAMDRVYSANPNEQFFTGGGLLSFVNFNKEDNDKSMPVRTALQHSVNLVFIRLMKDIAHYHIYQSYGVTPRTFSLIDESQKRRLLSMFADEEGKLFIRRFRQKYEGKNSQDAIDLFFMSIHPLPARLSAAFRYLKPEDPVEKMAAFLKDSLPDSNLTEPFIRQLYERYAPGKFSLADTGYIARIHPLELWVVKYLIGNPGASQKEVLEASVEERQAVYQWLFKTKSSRKQYKRIRTIIELEAFERIHRAWKRLGYPFDFLVPSYASAIGSSADRPGALAELVGIILNNGVRYPLLRIETLHFAEGTPYETVLNRVPDIGEQVLDPEVAQVVQKAILSVVDGGTASRLRNALKLSDGRIVPIGGKTGTGDHRYKTFGSGGILIGSKVMNRAATFAFMIGDRYFGSINAYVAGSAAANYHFTSALPVQVLKYILPDLVPFIEEHGIKAGESEVSGEESW